MKIFTHFSPPPDVRSVNKEASLTQQEFKDECDLNKIMEKYAAGLGTIPLRADVPLYGDFSNIPDFAEAFNIVQDATSKFEALPSNIRDRFDHDPAKLLEFLRDKANFDEAVELGLIPSETAPAPSIAPAPAPEAPKPDGGSDGAAGN